jgi:hypothetical protein
MKYRDGLDECNAIPHDLSAWENQTNGRRAIQKGAVMFDAAQQNQHHPTVQPENGGDNRKIQRALSVLQLFSEVAVTLFIAGIVVPSFLRSGMATNHALAAGSLRVLHALTIGGVTFSYTVQNLGSAVLGGLFGSLIALAIEFPPTVAKTSRNLLTNRSII